MKKAVTLFCMTEKGYRVLDAIVTQFPQVIDCVVSARDSNIEKDYYDKIVILCKKNGIKIYERKSFSMISSCYAIAVSWRWLIDTSSTRLIIFHDSLLPKYRGFAPLVSALINGEKKIGVTALFAAEEYDCGDIIAHSTSLINYPIKIQSAIELLTENYKKLVIKIIKEILNERVLHCVKQDNRKASYSLWLDEDDYKICWEQDSENIKRFIDSVGKPYKGAMTIVEGKRARIMDAEVIDDVLIENRIPGKVIFVKQNQPVVVCGKGLLKITNIVDDETNDSLLPFSKFRLRFK